MHVFTTTCYKYTSFDKSVGFDATEYYLYYELLLYFVDCVSVSPVYLAPLHLRFTCHTLTLVANIVSCKDKAYSNNISSENHCKQGPCIYRIKTPS